ncbi:MAG TPA: restriction endonuclease subunit M [Bacteroidia bacterium]|nr:restriction endonuclease subunit M [Bacteroidia bacterium]
MGLFQKSVLKKYKSLQDKKAIEKAFKKYAKYFHNPEIQQNIRESKEEQYQEGFLRELFVNILNYTINPNPNFNLTTELKNEKGAKKADGAILQNGKAIAVIELKGTKTKDLESIRQQAFDYKANQSSCVYVITSNFEKLRFYIENAVEFEEFNLFTLNEKQFELLYLCLQKENLLQNIPSKIKNDSVVKEEEITKHFYKDYSIFKRELFRDLVKQNMKNEVFRNELQTEDQTRAVKNIKLALFKKSQKLIDRFLFVFFAEDKSLLPPNSTIKILEQWNKLKDLDAYVPLYDRYKLYFKYLDTGRKGTDKSAEIFAYNGGLFKPDPILDSLLIDDNLLYNHTKTLSTYNFESQVSVNILGHIFENSLNEIESVNAEIEGEGFDKQKTKRKKDGIFYTPKYITKYIVDNTIGKLCEEKKQELHIEEEEYQKSRKGRKTETIKKLKNQLEQYRNWLLELTILDPACGSGAFLNQALDFLITEHKYIDELETSLLGGGIVFRNIENTILENNIFGVDLNEESVEIAKLSLWLSTAQPRRKLNSLNNNVKCGNSLVSDKRIVGEKAFNWQEEFSDIFKNGGFDIIIGNPPYVNVENLDNSTKKYIFSNYETAKGRTDLYIAFVELSLSLVEKNGLIGFIIPYAFTNQNYGELIRKKIVEEHSLKQIVDTSSYMVFSDAMVKTIILVLGKEKKEIPTKIFHSYKPYFLNETKHEINQDAFSKLKKHTFETKQFTHLLKIKQKIEKKSIPLENICLVAYGVRVNSKTDKEKPKSFYISQEKKDNYKKFIEGKDIGRYWHKQTGWLNYQPTEHYNSMFPELFENEKLMFINVVSNKVRFTFDNDNLYNSHTVINCVKIDKLEKATHISAKRIIKEKGVSLSKKYDTKFLLSIVNSNLLNWYFFNFQSEGLHFYPDDAKQFPIIKLKDNNSQKTLIEISERMLTKSSSFNKTSNQFIKYLKSQFEIDKPSKKLQNWYELDFGSFIVELNKAIKKVSGIKLTKKDEMEWLELFEEKKEETQKLELELNKIDNEINRIVYKLYDLTPNEIEVIENNV